MSLIDSLGKYKTYEGYQTASALPSGATTYRKKARTVEK